ncbi:hypothetical protein EVAR_64046_1 [Eumeta japonica]|uniref:Uncharacterized protein n=1 Tax=Eumeta variegata TaxID=151549 RepID=A0A4C1ZW33_EUMVA|nr:hypothetical protein EVAR_64046_1 [Eumeta japonica]
MILQVTKRSDGTRAATRIRVRLEARVEWNRSEDWIKNMFTFVNFGMGLQDQRVGGHRRPWTLVTPKELVVASEVVGRWRGSARTFTELLLVERNTIVKALISNRLIFVLQPHYAIA